MSLPYRAKASELPASATSITLNGVLSAHFVGSVVLANPSGGAKTIRAGAGRVHWATVTSTTFGNAGTTLRVGIQDPSTTLTPGQGDDSVPDVYADLVGGTAVLADNTNYQTDMTVGTKTLTHGQIVCVQFDMRSRVAPDQVKIAALKSDLGATRSNFPGIAMGTLGALAQISVACPLVGLEFEDGTVGWVMGGENLDIANSTSVTYNLNSVTADEYGNYFIAPANMIVYGVTGVMYPVGSSSDFEVCLYMRPFAAEPVLLSATIVDANTVCSTALGSMSVLLPSPVVLNQGQEYVIAIRPTTANDVTVGYQSVANPKFQGMASALDDLYAVRRIGNAGPFTDFNGGTAKTRTMLLSARLTYSI